jgi:hypothetical protein
MSKKWKERHYLQAAETQKVHKGTLISAAYSLEFSHLDYNCIMKNTWKNETTNYIGTFAPLQLSVNSETCAFFPSHWQ